MINELMNDQWIDEWSMNQWMINEESMNWLLESRCKILFYRSISVKMIYLCFSLDVKQNPGELSTSHLTQTTLHLEWRNVCSKLVFAKNERGIGFNITSNLLCLFMEKMVKTFYTVERSVHLNSLSCSFLLGS